MTRRKIASKRRWIKRFMLGRVIPSIALFEHPGLKLRIERAGFEHLINRDAVQRKA